MACLDGRGKDIYTTIPLMEEILHQLVDSLSTIYRILYIPGGYIAGFLPTVCHHHWSPILSWVAEELVFGAPIGPDREGHANIQRMSLWS